MTPTASRVDDRLVVVAFDDRQAGEGELTVAHRRGIYLRDLTVQAGRAGAAAVVFVGFDSLSLREGASDRTAIAESEDIQRLGIAPLLELSLGADRPGIPRAARFRVDELAAHFAGIGLPLVPDGAVVRTVPGVAGAPTLEPGAVVRGEASAAEGLVYGLAARSLLAELHDGARSTATADGITASDRVIPLEDGRLRIRWQPGLDDYQDDAVLPADSVLGSTTTPAWTGKVVLVGTTDPAHTPYFDTPEGPMPELLIHANALNTLLTEEYLEPAPGWTALLAIGIAAAAVVLAWRRSWRWAAAVTVVVVAGWLLLSRVLAGAGWLLDPLAPTVAALTAFTVLVIGAVARQVLQRRRLAKLFSEYVPAAVARDLVESGRAETAQAGERLLVTVLFCDLRGFTSTAARLSPADVRSLLDIYYEVYSQIVFDHEGTVLQYTGDEIFAVFGAPLPRSDHAEAALACAQEMQAAVPDVNAALAERGLPDISFGIGLHSGLVVAAHVGSTIRRQYSIIGDPVNVGSRLCAQAGEHEIVYSQTLREHLAEPPDAPVAGTVRLKGIAEPVAVHRLVGGVSTGDLRQESGSNA